MCVSLGAGAQKLAVKNNLLYDMVQTPNIGFEAAVAKRWTVGINVGYNPWWHHANSNNIFPFGKGYARAKDDRIQWRHLLVAPEARYWLCSPFAGHFVGGRAFYSHFNMGNVKFPFGLYPSLKGIRRQGDAIALGAFYGYSWPLSTRWSLEAEAGIDVGYAWFKNYNCAHCGAYINKQSKPFVAPKIGINAVYLIK